MRKVVIIVTSLTALAMASFAGCPPRDADGGAAPRITLGAVAAVSSWQAHHRKYRYKSYSYDLPRPRRAGRRNAATCLDCAVRGCCGRKMCRHQNRSGRRPVAGAVRNRRYCEGFSRARSSTPVLKSIGDTEMAENADKKLAARLLEGDRKSFDAFFNSYYPRLFRFSLARLGNDHNLADETVQNVLCQALTKMSTYRGEAPLFSWLCTFCRYEISKQLKARGRAQGDTPLTEDDPAVRAALESMLAVSANDPDAAVYQGEISRLVQVAMDQLPALYADTLESKYVYGMSVVEIGDRIGKSAKATESILTRARTAFRDCFRTLLEAEQEWQTGRGELSSLFE